MSIVEVKNAKKYYALGKTTVEAVKGISFQIDQGDFSSIAGPSGSGKSTILNMIGLTDTHTDGEVLLQDQPVSALKEREITKERRQYVDFLIEEVGLTDRQKNRPNELSGGQHQRVAIARALVTKPLIVFADEPTANLDSATGDAILQLMKKVNRELKTTFIFSTHDAKIVELADHIIRLKDGLVTQNQKREGA